MLPGYNHNISYQGQVFHVQTEDSGVNSATITTQVFIGGNIITSETSSYKNLVAADTVAATLPTTMQEQHKKLLKALVSGSLDERIAARSSGAGSLNGPAPLNVEEGAQNRASLFVGADLAAETRAPRKSAATSTPLPAEATPQAPTTPVPSAPPPTQPPSQTVAPTTAAASLDGEPQPAAVTDNAATTQPPPPAAQEPPSPPPLPGKSTRATTGYRVIDAHALRSAFDNKDISSDNLLFDDLISNKSLDEVILAYLEQGPLGEAADGAGQADGTGSHSKDKTANPPTDPKTSAGSD